MSLAHFNQVCGPASPVFELGQNSRGQWVIREVNGRMEGVFAGRKEAMRFALYESGLLDPTILPARGPVEMKALR